MDKALRINTPVILFLTFWWLYGLGVLPVIFQFLGVSSLDLKLNELESLSSLGVFFLLF